MRNVSLSVSVHNFSRLSLRDRCWKGRVKGKITSIAFFHAWFADFSLPFQLCRIRSVYNAIVNPHFDYSSGVGIFLWVACPYESEYFETYNIFLHESAFWRFLNLGGLRPGLGECGYEKMRFQQCGIRMDWVWQPFFQNLKNRVTRFITLQKKYCVKLVHQRLVTTAVMMYDILDMWVVT